MMIIIDIGITYTTVIEPVPYDSDILKPPITYPQVSLLTAPLSSVSLRNEINTTWSKRRNEACQNKQK